MKLFSPIKLVRSLAVFLLALWLAGAGCLLGCEGVAAASTIEQSNSSSSAVTTVVEDGDACGSESHSCCKTKSRVARKQPAAKVHKLLQDPSSAKLNESSTTGMKACPFAISRALSVAKLRDGKTSAPTAVSYVLPTHAAGEQKRALSTISPPLSRGHTYLRCCSFLI